MMAVTVHKDIGFSSSFPVSRQANPVLDTDNLYITRFTNVKLATYIFYKFFIHFVLILEFNYTIFCISFQQL